MSDDDILVPPQVIVHNCGRGPRHPAALSPVGGYVGDVLPDPPPTLLYNYAGSPEARDAVYRAQVGYASHDGRAAALAGHVGVRAGGGDEDEESEDGLPAETDENFRERQRRLGLDVRHLPNTEEGPGWSDLDDDDETDQWEALPEPHTVQRIAQERRSGRMRGA